MLRILFIAMLLIPSALAQEPAEVTDSAQSAAHDPEQFTFEIRFISAAEEVIEQIPKECLKEISKPKAKEPFEDWDQDQAFEGIGTGAVLVGQPTWQIRPTEITRVATLDDDQMIRLIQSAQGDSRSNIMSAPKVTVYRDQVGTIEDCARIPLHPIEGGSAAAKGELLNGTQVHVRVTFREDGTFWSDSEILLHSIAPAQQNDKSEQTPKTPTRQLTDTFRLSQQVNDGKQTAVIIPPTSMAAEEPPKPKIRLAGFRKPLPVQPRRILIAIAVSEVRLEELGAGNQAKSQR